ncbi:MAG: 50S ribosomal protein L9 [Treponema sp.]|nr:50S ribosomal protein L9 [Treponema sp.]
MRVILNKDLLPLGEEGDVKDVAKGYARNYLFPRGIALPYTERNIKLFESRREEIELRKVQKRGDAAGLKEKLEGLVLEITMPAGPNGKLYGAVTSQTIMDELTKLGFKIERKKIDLPGNSVKNVGKFKATVKLYENASAELSFTVIGQEIKIETRKAPPPRPARRRRDEQESTQEAADTAVAEIPEMEVPPEIQAAAQEAEEESSDSSLGEE